ncbi:MAG: glycerate kinase [Gammaproteobacteria bacterium]|nr:glycerate kinase [Gammaproteobacteria bacterium]
MHIIIAPDSFKECLSAQQVAHAIAEGWRRVAPDDVLTEVPLADGGEGTTVALVNAQNGSLHSCSVTDPMGMRVTAQYGLLDNGSTAVMEVAEASGLHRVPPQNRNALIASSRGTGELILAALQHRPRSLIIGLGGSATTDAGVGLLQALGASFTDADRNELPPGGAALMRLAHMDIAAARKLLEGVEITLATDVSNDLLGSQGAAAVYSPQKGASPDEVAQLERCLQHYAECAHAHGFTVNGFSGSGAAGGIGASLQGLLGATLVSGVETVIRAVNLEQHMSGADVVITGEGSLDGQSASGKVPVGVCRLAQKYGVPVIALAGVVGDSLESLYALGLTAAFAITPGPLSREASFASAEHNLAARAEQLARLLHATVVK